MVDFVKGNRRRKKVLKITRFGNLAFCFLLLMLLWWLWWLVCVYFLFSHRFLLPNHESNSKMPILLEPPGPLFHPTILKNGSTNQQIIQTQTKIQQQQQQRKHPHRVLVIAAAPRSPKHIVSLWSSLECFATDADHVAISAPTWSQPILERFIAEASQKIPLFASGQASLEGMVTINDRYDVGLWCDALFQMGVGRVGSNNNNNNIPKSSSTTTTTMFTEFDEIALLNDSVYALREFHQIFKVLRDKNVNMSSLNYSLIHPTKGTGDQYYWLESVWRGFDKRGIQTFADYSCSRPANDPLFCSTAWWGKKGCIVENFERAMARQFARTETVGLYASDVPRAMLSLKHGFPSWVRHAPYWNKLVQEQDFPVSKVNWEGMIDSIDDERLMACTQHLDRSWLAGASFDFSVAESSI